MSKIHPQRNLNRLSRNDAFCDRLRFRNWLSVFQDAVYMHSDGPANEVNCFFERRSRSDASGQIRHMRTIACPGLFEQNGVSHFSPACFRILFCVFGSRSIAGCPAIVTRPFLNWMFVLTVTPFLVHYSPTITLNEPNRLTNLHVLSPFLGGIVRAKLRLPPARYPASPSAATENCVDISPVKSTAPIWVSLLSRSAQISPPMAVQRRQKLKSSLR